MSWSELSDTLLALVEGFDAPPGSGLVVTEVLIDVPIEAMTAVRDGKLVVYGSPPHTRWKSGVLPPVGLGRLHVVACDADGVPIEPPEPAARPGPRRLDSREVRLGR